MSIRNLVFLALVTPPAASAQEIAACNLGEHLMFQSVAELFDGEWQVRSSGGFSVIDGKVATIPASNVAESSTISVTDEGRTIVMTSPNVSEPIPLIWADEARWVFEDAGIEGAPPPNMTSQDQEIITGCPNTDLARLVGVVEQPLGQQTHTVTYRLMVLGENLIHGFIHTAGSYAGKSTEGYLEISLSR